MRRDRQFAVTLSSEEEKRAIRLLKESEFSIKAIAVRLGKNEALIRDLNHREQIRSQGWHGPSC